MTKLLMDYYNPKHSIIVQIFNFNTCVWATGESNHSSELHCEYGYKLPEMLRDRLVCGVNHSDIAQISG